MAKKRVRTKKSKSTDGVVKGYKGFNHDWTCRGFQFAPGKVYETENAKLCDCGYHFCEDPNDVFEHYPPIGASGKLNKFAKIEATGVTDEKGDDSKRATTKIKILAEIGLADFVKSKIKSMFDKITSMYSATTGDRAHSVTTGSEAHSATTGFKAHSATTGSEAHSVTTGSGACSAVKGRQSIAASLGFMGTASGALGCWLVLPDWRSDQSSYVIKEVKAIQVDGEVIKPGVFYGLRNGEIIEVA